MTLLHMAGDEITAQGIYTASES